MKPNGDLANACIKATFSVAYLPLKNASGIAPERRATNAATIISVSDANVIPKA